MRRASRVNRARVPITMPAIAPPDSLDLDEVELSWSEG
jgi:hypothetical protein